ncbi:MAG: 50S ribosomal protein L11 methyltransferase [Armatimonadota bacterium]|nr:50S ribosomal protein L11 methyltransferase [Armatimonadota bacterium]MDR7536551.1 50S ribosomal protein L11 methyltransferase [Armatimonadota bacterium]
MRWIEVAVAVRPGEVEAAGALLLRAAPAGFAEVLRRRRRVLLAYLPASAAGRAALRRLRLALRGLGLHPQARVRSEAGWLVPQHAHHRPVPVGPIEVQPAQWRRPPAGGRVAVRLDAGMAFGSGTHPTTQLCLRGLLPLARGARVIDVGTGSGILAIAAARLGAARVLAIDTDPVAVAVARANVRNNGVGQRVHVRQGDGVRGVRGRADLVLANLTAEEVGRVLPQLVRRLRPGGRVVLSGFSYARAAGVAAAAARCGLAVERVARLRGWAAVHARTDARQRTGAASGRRAGP